MSENCLNLNGLLYLKKSCILRGCDLSIDLIHENCTSQKPPFQAQGQIQDSVTQVLLGSQIFTFRPQRPFFYLDTEQPLKGVVC